MAICDSVTAASPDHVPREVLFLGAKVKIFTAFQVRPLQSDARLTTIESFRDRWPTPALRRIFHAAK